MNSSRIVSTHGNGLPSLHFPCGEESDKIYQDFVEKQRQLYFETYGKILDAFGIYAGNQDTFVSDVKKLNEYDTKRDYDAYVDFKKSDKI